VLDLSRSSGLRVDLLDADAVRAAVRAAAPDVVHHLAARAHVGESWRMPEAYVRDNAAMTFHLLDAVREAAPGAAVVVAASSELYGPPAQLPVDELAPLRPQNPYAVSKAGADRLAGFFADAHGLRVVRARAFNHAGPGQAPIYAIASFTRQIAAGIVAGEQTVRVVTGNPDARRDYTDVRDVVRAYGALADSAAPGTYNVCSGRPASAAELLEALGRVTGVEIDHVVDDSLRRANEVMEVRGSYDRLHTATGWEPEIPLEQTLSDTVEWWATEIRAGRAPARLHE
jgi:GDP-4-dehydro-6-deoxy-D-mannose reductase